MYQQFAVTIAVSVIFSAFNALTLSPALSGLLLQAAASRAAARWRLSSGGSTGCLAGDRWLRHCVRPSGFKSRLLASASAACACRWQQDCLARRSRPAFCLMKTRASSMRVLQLPDASSLQRTSEAAKEVENIMLKTPGVAHVSSVMGYNMLSGVNSTFNAFFFVSFQALGRAKTRRRELRGDKAQYQPRHSPR